MISSEWLIKGVSEDFSAPFALDLEFLWQPSLLQNRIRCVPRFDFRINNKVRLRDRTQPNFVVAFSSAHETATCGKQ
jgi:hypothetical protein